MINQKEAVFNAVTSIATVDNNTVALSKAQRDQVISIVSAGFEAGEISLAEKAAAKYLGNPKELKSYTSGLVNNWLRKDTRLNGGGKYITKKPGSRAGSGDATVKNLKALLTTLSDDDQRDQVEQAIEKRQNEIKVEKAKTVEVNVDLLPAELREKLGL
jgi:hypothetical protein